MAIFLLLVLILLHSEKARAEKFTVQELYSECTVTDAGVCFGFIAGVGTMLNWMSCPKSPNEETPTFGAMVQAFKDWAKKHPEAWSRDDTASGVVTALHETWPCVHR